MRDIARSEQAALQAQLDTLRQLPPKTNSPPPEQLDNLNAKVSPGPCKLLTQ